MTCRPRGKFLTFAAMQNGNIAASRPISRSCQKFVRHMHGLCNLQPVKTTSQCQKVAHIHIMGWHGSSRIVGFWWTWNAGHLCMIDLSHDFDQALILIAVFVEFLSFSLQYLIPINFFHDDEDWQSVHLLREVFSHSQEWISVQTLTAESHAWICMALHWRPLPC